MVSVVIAARNEDSNLPDLIYDLVNQEYPLDKLEVIFVNDRSTDLTNRILNEASDNYSFIKQIVIEELSAEMTPKKYALTKGIESANGEIIISTDADCRVGKLWVSSMTSDVIKSNGISIGFSKISDKSFFDQYQKIDFLGIISANAGAGGWKQFWSGTGQNLAYFKSDFILIDGFEGIAIINPSEGTLFRYGKVGLQRNKIKDLFAGEISLPPETQDGLKIHFLANADTSEEVKSGIENGCVGVGLFRTESIFLSRNQIPSEDQQFEEYQKLVVAADGKPVTIRTLDLGGDKILDSIGREKEENPFMGFRAIRYCLRNPSIFLDQLRAILRVSAFGSVKIMFPMISGVEELVRAKEFLFTAKRQLSEKGVSFDNEIKVGCMIETPSAVTICDMLADEVDFFSVGTNDLVQYLLAVDRINNEIAYLYEPHHPAVIRSLKHIFDVSKEKNVEVTLCGEIAGDPHFLPLLIGLGLDTVSATGILLPELKFYGRRFTLQEAQSLSERIKPMKLPSEIKVCLKDFYDDRISDLIK